MLSFLTILLKFTRFLTVKSKARNTPFFYMFLASGQARCPIAISSFPPAIGRGVRLTACKDIQNLPNNSGDYCDNMQKMYLLIQVSEVIYLSVCENARGQLFVILLNIYKNTNNNIVHHCRYSPYASINRKTYYCTHNYLYNKRSYHSIYEF